MRVVKSEWQHALFHEPTPLSAFAAVGVPTLFLTGSKSKASALAIARLVTSVLRRVRIEEIEGVGHMPPYYPPYANPNVPFLYPPPVPYPLPVVREASHVTLSLANNVSEPKILSCQKITRKTRMTVRRVCGTGNNVTCGLGSCPGQLQNPRMCW
jgi:hypothetical protein